MRQTAQGEQCGATKRLRAKVGLLVLATLPVASGVNAQRRQSPKQPVQSAARVAVAPAPVSELLREAAALLAAGRLDEAEPLLRRAVNVAPLDADAHNLLGVVHDQRGRTREAEAEFRTALRLNSQAVSARANLGVLLARTQR